MKNRQTTCTLTLLVLIPVALFACANSDLAPTGSDGGDVRGGNDGSPNNGMPNNGNPNNGTPNNVTNSGADGGDTTNLDMGPDIPPVVCESGAAGWNRLGGPISIFDGETNGTQPSIAVDSECRPVIAFHEGVEGETPDVQVLRWENGAWNPLGGPLDATAQTDKFTTSVEVRTFGTEVVVAWSELTDDGTRIFVARWNDTSWDVSIQAPNGGSVFSFVLGFILDENGNAIVAWNERPADLNFNIIRVAKLENETWTNLGDNVFANTNTGALSPSLTSDAQDRPVLSWQEMNDIHIRTWDGTSWASLLPTPLKSPEAFSAFDANVASNGPHLVAGWRESFESTNVFVRSVDATNTWIPVVQSLNVESDAETRTNTNNLTISVSDTGDAFFAFDEIRDGTTNVHVFRNDVPLGELSALAGDTPAYWADIALDFDDRPIVVWSEDDGTSVQVYVSRYDQ